MKWFKFYGQDYLTDPKMKLLSVEMRQCWIVLLCLASSEEKGGKIRLVDELEVLRMAGVEEDGQLWHEARFFISLFADLEMLKIDKQHNDNVYDVTLINFNKRQGEAMTAYERVKKYREKKKHDNGASLSKRNNLLQNVIKYEANDNVDNENDNDRIDKIRIDKNNTVSTNGDKNLLKKLPDILDDKQRIDGIANYLVDKLNDEKSLPFYRLVASKVPEGHIRKTVSEILHDGADDPRKVFNFRMSKYALTVQVQL